MPNVALGKPVLEPVNKPESVTDGNVIDYTAKAGFTWFDWPGYLTIDMEQAVKLSTIRLLLWDGLGTGSSSRDPRGYRYRLLTSLDSQTWNVLFDSGRETYNGWQVFHLKESILVQYVRIHGLWNSVNPGFHLVQVEAFDEMPPPLNAEVILDREIGPEVIYKEEGNALPLGHSVDAIIRSLENLIGAYSQVVNPKPFHDLITQLRLQVSDIAALERRMGAVRRQLTEPVAAELQRGRRYSMGGYWFGLIGGLATIFSLGLYVWDRFFSK